MFQTFPAYRKKFAFIVGRSRRLGEIVHIGGPKYVFLAPDHPLHRVFDSVVVGHRDTIAEIGIRTDLREMMFPSELRIAGSSNQLTQLLFLYFFSVHAEAIEFFQPGSKYLA